MSIFVTSRVTTQCLKGNSLITELIFCFLDTMKRIVIQLSELSRENWGLIYRFIERCEGRGSFTTIDFKTMKDHGIDVGIDESPTVRDVCSINEDGITELHLEAIPQAGEYVYNIIYVKKDRREEFSEITRFFLLKKRYAKRITMGINADVYTDSDYFKYTFQLGIFLYFIKDKAPELGLRSIYLIETINNTLRAKVFPYMRKDTEPDYDKASPFLFPLIPLNETNISIFENGNATNDQYDQYINGSIVNINKRLSKKKRSEPKLDDCVSLFEKWLVSAFYLSLEDEDLEKFSKWRPILAEYSLCIFELLQNILFHTQDRRGLFYVVINKKEKVSSSMRSCLPYFENYSNTCRLIEFGIYDYGTSGIVKKALVNFNLQGDNYKLRDFFELEKLNRYNQSRGSEHLGLRYFVNSIKEHGGYFRVESNNQESTNQESTKDIIENAAGSVSGEKLNDVNINGTLYDVVIPVLSSSELISDKRRMEKVPYSRYCLSNILNNSGMNLPICFLGDPRNSFMDLENSAFLNKEQQETTIKTIANDFYHYFRDTDNERLVIDLKTRSIRPNILYKLIDNLFIINKEEPINKTLILINLSDDTINLLCYYYFNDLGRLNESKRFPIVLMGDNWRIQVLYGERKAHLLDINKSIHNMFFSEDCYRRPDYLYDASAESWKNTPNDIIDDLRINAYFDNFLTPDENKISESVALPYDLMINNFKGESLFASLVNRALDTPIEDDKNPLGCKVELPTKIGSKLYIKNYFEADFLFYNNFFTDRFAYFIAKEIVQRIDNRIDGFIGKKLVLIGYYPYSETLAERVREYVNAKHHNAVSDIIIAKQRDRDNEIVFKMSKEQAVTFSTLSMSYSFITIVPIASTLSTTDKIIAIFSNTLDRIHRNINGSNSIAPHFVYNYVTILVRNKTRRCVTKEERSWRWSRIKNFTINTSYRSNDKTQSGISVDFLIQKSGFWRNLISLDTFPKLWWEEKYINQTKKSSINIKEMHGLPSVALPSISEMRDEVVFKSPNSSLSEADVTQLYYNLSEKRLKEMKDFIYYGHFNHEGSHHQYYFDFDRFFDSNYQQDSNSSAALPYPELERWLSYVSRHISISSHNKLNVIITPDHESCYVSTINRRVFNNNASVVYLDLNAPLQDSTVKLDYLKDWHKDQFIHYYFVDEVLQSGKIYQKTRSRMAAILGKEGFAFDGVITMINRLSKNRYQNLLSGLELHRNGKQAVFSFLCFFVLPTSEPDNDCSLCAVHDLYKNLRSYSVIDDCHRVIDNNRKKIDLHDLSDYLIEGSYIAEENHDAEEEIVPRKVSESSKFLFRMLWRHRLFFGLTTLKGDSDYHDYLDSLYQNECKTLDDKISFFKAITFPPLSLYGKIREYAHSMQLKMLKVLLYKKQYEPNDFILLKVLLKHLSFLGSNAIVRKSVIMRSWKLYDSVKKSFPERFKQNNDDSEFISKFIFYVKLASYKDEAKSLWLGELLRTGKEMDYTKFGTDFKINQTKLYNDLWHPFYGTNFNSKLLPYLFYDNTTITRKTLDNFASSIDKNTDLYDLLKNKKGRLKPFSEIKKKVNSIVARFEELVENEYYFSWFKHFLDEKEDDDDHKKIYSPDGVPLLEKFVYVLYERLLLKDYVDPNTQNDKPFDQNAKVLLEVATIVMGADAAFIHIKDDKDHPYLLASHGFEPSDNKEKDKIYYDAESGDYLFKELLFETELATKGKPFVIIKHLHQGDYVKDESYKRATVLMLNRDNPAKDVISVSSKGSLIGMVSFLYKKEDSENNIDLDGDLALQERYKKDRQFMINAQESGRLLLLLKPQIDKYVKHVADEKQFEVWKEKQKYIEKYNNIFDRSRHAFGELVTPDLDKLDSYQQVPITFYRHANLIITNLYAELVNNPKFASDAKFKKDFTLTSILEDKFINLIKTWDRWHKERRGIFEGEVFKVDKSIDADNTHLQTEKFILQSFIFLSLHNAFMHERSAKKRIWARVFQDRKSIIFEIKNDMPKLSRDSFLAQQSKFDKIINVDNWESIFEQFGNMITISSIKAMYPGSSFKYDYERTEAGDIYYFIARIKVQIIG